MANLIDAKIFIQRANGKEGVSRARQLLVAARELSQCKAKSAHALKCKVIKAIITECQITLDISDVHSERSESGRILKAARSYV
jgi:hypothetical protein